MAEQHNIINRPLKVTVVGDGTVGKTCLLIAYTTNSFPTEYVPTVFDNYSGKHAVNGIEYAITLWDTAGQEEYQRIRQLSYSQTKTFVVCFSLENRSSFDNVSSKWLPELRKESPNTPIVLVGTKMDIRRQDLISPKEGKKLCQKEKLAAYVECSAKTREGIHDVINEAISAAHQVCDITVQYQLWARPQRSIVPASHDIYQAKIATRVSMGVTSAAAGRRASAMIFSNAYRKVYSALGLEQYISKCQSDRFE